MDRREFGKLLALSSAGLVFAGDLTEIMESGVGDYPSMPGRFKDETLAALRLDFGYRRMPKLALDGGRSLRYVVKLGNDFSDSFCIGLRLGNKENKCLWKQGIEVYASGIDVVDCHEEMVESLWISYHRSGVAGRSDAELMQEQIARHEEIERIASQMELLSEVS